MVKSYIPENTQKNRVLAYRFADIIFGVLVVLAVVVWYMNREEPEPTLLETQVEELVRGLESLYASQQGTIDYLIEQRIEIATQFEELAVEVSK